MSNAMAQVGAFVNRKFSINRNTGQPRPSRRFSIGEPSTQNTGTLLPFSPPPLPTATLLTAVDCPLQRRAPRSIVNSELLTSKPLSTTSVTNLEKGPSRLIQSLRAEDICPMPA